MRGLLSFADRAVWAPLRAGRLDHRRWPPGLAGVVGVGFAFYALLLAVVVLAGPLRNLDTLGYTLESGVVTPGAGLSVVTAAALFCLALALTAALHCSWPLRLVALAVAAMAFVSFALSVLPPTSFVALGAWVGLVGLTIWRSRRGFAWWEVLPVTALVALGALGPLLIAGATSTAFGYSGTGATLGALYSLAVLGVPALVAAGASLVQIVVNATEAAAVGIARDAGLRATAWIVGAIAAVRLVDVALTLAGGGVAAADLAPSALHVALGVVALVAVAAVVRGRHVLVSRLSPGWSDLVFPMAAVLFWVVALLFPLLVLNAVASTLGWTAVVAATEPFRLAAHTPLGNRAVRAVAVVATAAVLVARYRRRRPELVALGALFTIGPLLGLAAQLGSWPSAGSSAGIGLALSVMALAAFGWSVATGRLVRHAVPLGLALALSGLYAHREAITDPLSAAFGFAPVLALLVGLVWRVLVDGDFANADGRAIPRPARVLLHVANSLFAVTVLAYVALSRSAGNSLDLDAFAAVGDDLLGTPLLVGAVLVPVLGAVLSPPRTPLGAP